MHSSKGASDDRADRHTWSWRRVFCAGNRSLQAVNVGDITQQNLGNDLDTAYLFPSLADVRAEAASAAGWRGGVNLTALRMLEDRAYVRRTRTFPICVSPTLSIPFISGLV